MKRSEINQILRDAIAFFQEYRFVLPPFAHWTPEQWRTKGPEARQIVQQNLGWDITDFGGGDFAKLGLFLFTIRNGTVQDLNRPGGKTYAEKIMIVREGQVTPIHFHHQKMEDIINRGGGRLVVQLWNATPEEGLASTDVTVSTDGVQRTVAAGGTITLGPGESISLAQRVYHSFWGQPGAGTVLVGEVSQVNDDHTDNRFHAPLGRFPTIQEDQAPLHLLVNDYAKYYRHA